jgi:eukaryotic-like serine/threonine-protein kinase
MSTEPPPSRSPPAIAEPDPLTGTAYRCSMRAGRPVRLGRGAMGEVLEAEHVALGKRVAVKLLRAELAANPDVVDRLRLESQIARIVHPNLVSITDVGCTPEGRPFLVMERLTGHTLRAELTNRGHLPIGEAIDLVRQLLAGLGALHRAGIVHRDVKLENLFLCEPIDGGGRTLKLLDFGVAKVIDARLCPDTPAPLALATREGVAVGTPRYIAPEVALGGPVRPCADVYAAGMVLYMLVAGRDPFHELRDFLSLIRAHATVDPCPPSTLAPQPVSPAVDAVILKAIARRTDDRFNSAAELAEALSAMVDSGARWSRTEPLPVVAIAEAGVTRALDPEATTAEVAVAADRRPGVRFSTWTAAALLLVGVVLPVVLTLAMRHLFP